MALADQSEDLIRIHIHVIMNNTVAETNDAVPFRQFLLADEPYQGQVAKAS